MELDKNTVAIIGVVVAILLAEMRLLRRKLEVLIPALMERSRRRDQRKRRDSDTLPPVRRRSGVMNAVPGPWTDDDETDIHVLMDLEREKQRSRRKTGQHRPGERSPRPGTHHDR